MAKSKHAPALFEVLEKAKEAKGQLKVPAWVGTPASGSEASTPSVEADAPVAIRPAHPVPAVVAAADHAGGGDGAGEPLWSYDGQRLRVSLTKLSAGLVFAGLVVIFGGAYRLGSSVGASAGYESGRRSYEAATVATIEEARQQPVNEELVSSLRTASSAPVTGSRPTSGVSPDSASRTVGAPPAWVKGNTYVVVQEFRPDSGNDVWIAQGFFAEQGLATSVVTRSSGHLWLVTTEGYNYGDPAQKQLGKVLSQRVRDIGKAYQQAGGRYACEGYERTLTGDSW
jgi:hypothetical protein